MGIAKKNNVNLKSPDPVIKRKGNRQSQLARIAHVNDVLDHVQDYAEYDLDVSAPSPSLAITTSKGVINIQNAESWNGGVPGVAFATPATFDITNDDITADATEMRILFTVYYDNAATDTVVPYVIGTLLAVDTLTVTVYNANGAAIGANGWEGTFTLAYEIVNMT